MEIAGSDYMVEGEPCGYTSFIHKTANVRKRLNAIHSLKVVGTTITEERFIHKHVDTHFKNNIIW